MISAYRAGLSAGSTTHSAQPSLSEDEQRKAAHDELSHRKQAGIAHIVPETEFVRGFIDGYNGPALGPDGLQLYSQTVARI
jgi:hypothetical protein